MRSPVVPLQFLLILCPLLLTSAALAHEPEADVIALPEVEVISERPLEAASQRVVTGEQIRLQPQGRPGDLLRLVPGLITVNPSGSGGKADQFLLRGFDADHGTDVAFFIDGMPINLRSHAHGQGYTDLNFLIPETLKEIEAHKGPYQVQYGDFATAGAVNFVTRDVVEGGVVQASGGQFNTQRHLLMLSPTTGRVRTLMAAEGYLTDGPFASPNRHNRFNGLFKATLNPTARSELSLTGTHYQGRWNSSGQIPFREVAAGRLDRFGAIDPTEGGRTLRSTGRLRYHYDMRAGGTAFADLYLQYYRLDLFSNFTFFLNDPVNGDGIEQNDRRFVYGGDLGYRQAGALLGMPASATLGFQARVDEAQVRLGRQRRRAPLGTTSDSDIVVVSYSPYMKVEVQPLPWMRLVGGARADFFQFEVRDRCGPGCPQRPSGTKDDVIATAKGSLILGPWYSTELFFNVGTGFHSNDARAVVSGQNAETLPRATGYEAGVRTKPWRRLEFLASVWALDLTSELVFVGDEGTTEIRGASRRYGTELGTRIVVIDEVALSGDVTWTHAEFRGTGQAVPLAPEVTARADLTVRLPMGGTAMLQMLHLGRRPAIEDRAVTTQPFTVFDLVTRYRLPVPVERGRLEAFLAILNLTDTNWRQAQFFYTSRLSGEPVAGVGDIHFVPGTPRMVMGGVSWYF